MLAIITASTQYSVIIDRHNSVRMYRLGGYDSFIAPEYNEYY